MPDFEAVEVLTQAKERIMEHGWGTGSTDARALHGDESSYCLEDALCGRDMYLKHLTDQGVWGRVDRYMRKALGGWTPSRDLYEWNDSHAKSADEVLDALDAAMLVAKEAPTPE